jgi:hypothetical protein
MQLAAATSQGYGLVRPIADPAYIITPDDNGYCLIWDHLTTDARWRLPAAMLNTMEVVLLRVGPGGLSVIGEEGAIVNSPLDTFERQHRAVAYQLGQMHCRMWKNPTGTQAHWIVTGETMGV